MNVSQRARSLVISAGFLPMLRTGRWALTLIQGFLSLALVLWFPNRPAGAYLAMGLLLSYNLAVLFLMERIPLQKVPIRSILGLDFLFLAHVCFWTERSLSPFLGLFHLLVLVSALFFDLVGGLLAGLAAALIAIGLTLLTPGPLWELTRDTAPYFPIVGGFTGFVAGRMKRWQTQLQESETDAHLRRCESELARDAQRSTQPQVPPTLPGFSLAVRTEPSRDVGGDFYGFLAPQPGELHLILGDVSGKGMAAALTATGIGYLLPHLRTQSPPPVRLAVLNDDLRLRLPPGAFVALLYVVVETSGQVTLWNAGHTPPWHDSAELPPGGAPPLGLFSSWSGPSQTFTLAPGEALLLCSDGVLEVRDASGSEFGPERLATLLRAHEGAAPDTLADAVRDAVYGHGDPGDDLTILVLKRAGSERA